MDEKRETTLIPPISGELKSKTKMANSFNIVSTQITPEIRVSSAAIWYGGESRWQIETIIFSDDRARQEFRMWIHGSTSFGSDIPELAAIAKTFHRRIAIKLKIKLTP